MWCEVGLDVELGGCGLLAKALGVDGAGVALGNDSGARLADGAGEWDLALDGLLAWLTGDVEGGRGLEGLDDGLVWLEVAHALEVGDGQEWDCLVGLTDLGGKELVGWEVGVGEVELNLEIIC